MSRRDDANAVLFGEKPGPLLCHLRAPIVPKLGTHSYGQNPISIELNPDLQTCCAHPWQQVRKTAPAASMTAAWRSAAAATATLPACQGLNIRWGRRRVCTLMRACTWRELRWAREHHCPWDLETTADAAGAGHLEVLHRHLCEYTGALCAFAVHLRRWRWRRRRRWRLTGQCE